jgi:hypothetical protein
MEVIQERTITMADLKAAQSERLQPVVVTNDNFDAYVDDKLGVTSPANGNDGPEGGNGQDTIKSANADPEKVAAQQLADLKPAPKEGDEDGGKVYFNGKWVGKGDFGYRLHVKTKEATAEHEKKLSEAAKEAADAKAARDKAEARANELAARYEPPKPDVPGPEPKVEQFANGQEWAKAFAEHARDVANYEAKETARRADQAKAWDERKAAARKDIPDFEATLNSPEAADVKISAELTDAVRDSEYGPHLLHHFVKNRDVLNHLHSLPVGKMLRELGKLESTFGKGAQAAQTAAAPVAKAAPAVEVSRAPAPIEPIKAGSASAVTLSGGDEFHGTYEEYKEKRRRGLIK